MKKITNKQYIRELELSLIFLCEAYQAAKEAVQCRETEEGSASGKYTDLWFHFPIIQGSAGIGVEKIGSLRTRNGNREENKMTLLEIYERIHQGRMTQREFQEGIRKVVEKHNREN